MKIAKWIVVAMATAFALPAHAAVGDPLKVLYLFSGVTDTGGGGVATTVSCTSFSGVTETVQFVVRNANGSLNGTSTTSILASGSITAATKDEGIHTEDILLNTNAVQGTMAVLATTVNVVCTAAVIQSNITIPSGYMLHGARFNPIAGTQE